MREKHLRLIPGGMPARGDSVTVDGRQATVIEAEFSTHVFQNDVSVRYDDGEVDLISRDLLELGQQDKGPENH